MSVRHVIILGGGTAGWMSAAALSQAFPINDAFKLTLVEAPDIASVGVGEATIPPIVDFNRQLGIDEVDFIKATQASFKLGIRFEGWTENGSEYCHPFGKFGFDVDGLPFHQYWLKAQALAYGHDYGDYSLAAMASGLDKFGHPSENPRAVSSTLKYAFHFDASLYAKYLKNYAQLNGVSCHQGKVVSVKRCNRTGDIQALIMNDGQCLEADFFVDCSGFNALLIGETLEVGYQNWSQYLPCDRAVVASSESLSRLRPFTRAIAGSAGWQWQIPLQHRTGNGYVYASAFQDDVTAEDELISNMENLATAPPRKLKFSTGRRDVFWKNNCVAIGLSSGFLEPLESTSIHFVQMAISQLIAHFPSPSTQTVERNHYNKVMQSQYKTARDFLILHYYLNGREGEALWDYCRHMVLPDSLRERLELFKASGRFFKMDGELFDVTSWTAVMFGQGLRPESYDAILRPFPDEKIERVLEKIRLKTLEAAQGLHDHKGYIEAYCGVLQSKSKWTNVS